MENRGKAAGFGVLLGVTFGIMLGVAFKNFPMGFIIGGVLGIGFGLTLNNSAKKHSSKPRKRS